MDYILSKGVSKELEVSERQNFKLRKSDEINLTQLCKILSISTATGRNWIKLGKLQPKYFADGQPYFIKSYIFKLKKNLVDGKNFALKSRRNKKFISGNYFYNSYISDKSKNLVFIQNLLDVADKKNIKFNDNIIQYIIADCALHLFVSKNNIAFFTKSSFLKSFIDGELDLKEYNCFLWDLIVDKKNAVQFTNDYADFFSFNYLYEPNEDILGLLYISCKNMQNRKKTGSYYTPTKIAKTLISYLNIKNTDKILDPCCGTGNFILQLPEYVKCENIFANDIDSICVKITRLNMALKYPDVPSNIIFEHITTLNYLTEYNKKDFSHIIGNPPWGYTFSESDKINLRKLYKAASSSNIESFDIFIEKSLSLLKQNGQLSFILPESILNVKAHSYIRSVILNRTNIKNIDFLGNVFDGVQCPCIIFRLERTEKKLNTIGININSKEKSFVINTERIISSDNFNFFATDDEYRLIEKIKNNKKITTLRGNADFALGIVTGNNKDFLSSEKTNSNEIILKGSDIFKYRIKLPQNYIVYTPEKFQQAAPTKIYRAKEKLIYRFICNQLVFAYDDKQTLSLNSCNIVIPKIECLSMKYILAILNSRIAQFIYKKEFNSVKVLRSHIESIPIPVVDSNVQNAITEKVDLLIQNQNASSAKTLYEYIDSVILSLFDFSEKDKNVLFNALSTENIDFKKSKNL